MEMQGKVVRQVYVYWGPREENAEACAIRLRTYWNTLHSAFPLIEHWFDTGKTRKAAWTTECISALDDKGLERFLLSGVNRRDDNKEPIPSLGFGIGVWNQRKQPSEMAMSLRCGMWNPQMINNVSLSFPEDPTTLGINSDEDVLRLMEIGRSCWDADYGRVFALREMEPIFEKQF
jgi:hypothetical protein